MRSSILICATCLLVSTGCSGQLRFPSLSSALSSLTGFGGGGGGGGGSSAASNSAQSSGQSSSSPYSGFVRDYGRNLMMAMSSIYPSIFKPPQAQAQQQQQQQQQQSPFEQFAGSQPLQSLFSAASNAVGQSVGGSNSGSSGPSFSFGGSTFSISPSLPFGSLAGASQSQQQQGPAGQAPQSSHSPFSASFGSSINSPPSFGPLSSSPFFQSQSMPSFAPASSYNAAFEAANGGPFGGQQPGQSAQALSSFQSLQGSPSGQSSSPFGVQSSTFGDSSAAGSLLSPSIHQQQAQSQFGAAPPSPHGQASSAFLQGLQASAPSSQGQQQTPQASASNPHASLATGPGQAQFGVHHNQAQQYRPESMSFAASAPVPSSNSYSSNYGNIPSGPSQQVPASASYQQPAYR